MSNDTNSVYGKDILYTSKEDERISLFIKDSFTDSSEKQACNYLNSETGTNDDTVSNRRFTMRRGEKYK